jgi:hypothetical protein
MILNLGFWQQFGILATIWDFSNDLEFWQWFGILATIWDFGNSLGFGISAIDICRKGFEFRHIAEKFRHPSLI